MQASSLKRKTQQNAKSNLIQAILAKPPTQKSDVVAVSQYLTN